MSDPRQDARKELSYQRMQSILALIKERNGLCPITGKYIAFKIGVSNDVVVRQAVNALRKQCEAICSSGDGYWYASDSGELQQTIEELESRVRSVNEAITGLRIARDKMTKVGAVPISKEIDSWNFDLALEEA